MKKLLVTLISMLVVIASISIAQEKQQSSEPKFELVHYYFIMLSNGEKRNQPESVVQKIQAGHMANINKMAQDGLLVCAGTFDDAKGGGIFIIKTAAIEKVKELC